MNKPLTSATNVIDLYSKLEKMGVKIWIDGGWGVDALLGKQTRPHEDVDIVVQQKDLPKLRKLLEGMDYKDVKRDDTSAWNFVLGDKDGHLVDVHVIVFDDKKNGLYGPVEKGIMYPAQSLTGKGKINDYEVRCISSEWMIKFHSGYKLKDSDYHDVSALCKKFNVKLPKEYKKIKMAKKKAETMKWIAISGSWRKTNKKVEKDVRDIVRKIIRDGDGIISGGALGVDYFALDEAMKSDLTYKQIKIFLPSKLDIFSKHFFKRADEGVITYKQAKKLITQLKNLKKINPKALIENQKNKVLNKATYYQRILEIINSADELIAFQVNKSQGTQYTIDRAKEKDIPIKKFEYKI